MVNSPRIAPGKRSSAHSHSVMFLYFVLSVPHLSHPQINGGPTIMLLAWWHPVWGRQVCVPEYLSLSEFLPLMRK